MSKELKQFHFTEIYDQALKELLSSGEGIWVSKDVNFHLLAQSSSNQLTGKLQFGHDFFPFSQTESALLIEGLLNSGCYSVRSRLQQAGLHIRDIEAIFTKSDSSISVILDIVSLANIPLVNVPEAFPFLRLFLEDSKSRVTGPKMAELSSIMTSNCLIIERDERLFLPFKNENVSRIGAKSLDIQAILAAESRHDLHSLLSLKITDIDFIKKNAFYLAMTPSINLPSDYILRIDTDYSGDLCPFSVNHHLQSPIIDAGFKGRIVLEMLKTGLEEEPGRSTWIPFIVYPS